MSFKSQARPRVRERFEVLADPMFAPLAVLDGLIVSRAVEYDEAAETSPPPDRGEVGGFFRNVGSVDRCDSSSVKPCANGRRRGRPEKSRTKTWGIDQGRTFSSMSVGNCFSAYRKTFPVVPPCSRIPTLTSRKTFPETELLRENTCSFSLRGGLCGNP